MNEAAEFDYLPEMNESINGAEWTVDEDWQSPFLTTGQRVVLRKGFATDGASIPQAFWTVIGHPMQAPLLGPALCHDALYAGELVPDHSTADWMFLEWMQMAGIGWVKRNLVYSAVRTWGWTVWNKHTPASIAASRNMCALIDAVKDAAK